MQISQAQPKIENAQPRDFSYDGFASHATDPDGALVRAVEARIETFHRRFDVSPKYRRELELCVDGRDFVFSKRDRKTGSGIEVIEQVVRTYERLSRALVVFSGPESRDHPWIGKEVEWWEDERPNGPVYFALLTVRTQTLMSSICQRRL